MKAGAAGTRGAREKSPDCGHAREPRGTIAKMARAFVRVGLCLGLSSCLGVWSAGAAAQGTGDVVEDDSESEDKGDSQDQGSDTAEESKDDDGGGDWDGGGSAASESGLHFGLRLQTQHAAEPVWSQLSTVLRQGRWQGGGLQQQRRLVQV